MAHCYDKDGNPHFNLTPAQAKKEGLFFSVTEHQGVLAKAIELWKLGQHLKTAFQYPPRNGEDEQSFIKRIKGITWKNGGGAAELGTEIHAGIESVLNKEKKVEDLDVDLRKYVAPAIRYFESKKFEILDVEKVVVNEKQGYAGTADAVGKTPCGKKFILDWKSRKFGDRKVVPYDGQPEQVSAYGAGYLEKMLSKTKRFGASMSLYQPTDSPAMVSPKSLLPATPPRRWLKTTKPSA